MKQKTILLLFILLTASCQSDKLVEDFDFDPQARIVATLGNINLDNELTTDAQAYTRASYTRLPDGETFRLYALRSGVTNLAETIVSYTYTMKEGKPVMDKKQGNNKVESDGKLYLPYGKLDIYVVSPVQTPSDDLAQPQMIDIATPTAIIPRQGTDLKVSYTSTTISYSGSNQVSPTALKHKMAKVIVRVNRSDKNFAMKELILRKVELHNQYSEVGTYTLNADGGFITPTTTDGVGGISFAVTKGIDTHVEKKEYSATFMLLPRNAGNMKVDVEMDIMGVEDKYNLYRMSGIISNIPLIGGKLNQLFTEPETSENILWRPKLLPWNDETPLTPPMGGDFLLYLDGRDAPEMIGGKLCWRDRSGNNNHAEILSKNIVYDKEKHCYYFPAEADQMLIPPLGKHLDYTLEITAQTSIGSTGFIVQFNDPTLTSTRTLYLHFSYSTEGLIFFDSGFPSTSQAAGRISSTFPTTGLDSKDPKESLTFGAFYDSFHTYYFQKQQTTSTMKMGYDGVEVAQGTGKTAVHGSFEKNILGGRNNFRIRSVRLYRGVLQENDLKQNFQVDNSIYESTPKSLSFSYYTCFCQFSRNTNIDYQLFMKLKMV